MIYYPLIRTSKDGPQFEAIKAITEVVSSIKKETDTVAPVVSLESTRHDSDKEWLQLIELFRQIRKRANANDSICLVCDNPLVLWKGSFTDMLGLLQTLLEGYQINIYTRIWKGGELASTVANIPLDSQHLNYQHVNQQNLLQLLLTWDALRRSYLGKLAVTARVYQPKVTEELAQTILKLRFAEGKSYRAIAKQLNMSHMSVVRCLKQRGHPTPKEGQE